MKLTSRLPLEIACGQCSVVPSAEARRAPGEVPRPADRAPEILTALLAARANQERERTWAAFVEAYTPILLHTVRCFAHTYDDVMDCYTYLLEHLHHNDFRRLRGFATVGPGRFTTWLVVVARRLILDYHRARYGRASRATQEHRGRDVSAAMRRNLAEMVGEELTPAARESCATAGPEATAEAGDRAEAVRHAVTSLQPRDQLLLKLRYEEELPAHEIARVMGFASHSHVYRRLRKVLRLLGGLLHPEYADVDP